MAKSIGIDLGTTNSVSAVKRVQTEVLKNSEGDFITPSCVTFQQKKSFLFGKKEKNFIVGKNALEWLKQSPLNTIIAVKRLMGRNIYDKEIKEIIQKDKLHYKISRSNRGTSNSIAIIIENQEYTPENISEKILSKIRTDAEKTLKDEVEYAVITVPAYFNDKQKHATRQAAAMAGFKVRRLLPEPTAAAISFGVDNIKGDDALNVMVFDFGGGTFDLSVLTISGGQFIEQGKGGDMWLGGEDIDRMLSEYVLDEVAKEYEIEDIEELINSQNEKQKNLFKGELKAKVEQAKIRLSTDQEAYIEILGTLKDTDGDIIDVDVELTREDLNKIISPMLSNALKLTNNLLESIHFTKDIIDKVLLVGGSSRIPIVIEMLKKEFGAEKVMVHERPMLAIAEGAAILSHRLSNEYECPECGKTVSQKDSVCKNCNFDLEKYTIEQGVFDIVHSTSHDYYITLENNEKFLLVEKNTPLPFETKETFALVHENQKLVHMKFCNIVNEQEESIGDLWLGIETNDKDYSKGPLDIELTLKIDENNLVEISAQIKKYPEIKISKTLSRGNADEKLFMDIEKVIAEANEKKYSQYIITDLTYRALSIVKNINKIINPKTNEINEKTFDLAKMKIRKARKMASNDQTSKPTIFYTEALLKEYSVALPENVQIKLKRQMKNLEEMDEYGTYEENIKALSEIDNTLSHEIGGVSDLMEIDKAIEISAENNPSIVPKFIDYKQNILRAYSENNLKKVMELTEQIYPEVEQIVSKDESKTDIIYKDITKK